MKVVDAIHPTLGNAHIEPTCMACLHVSERPEGDWRNVARLPRSLGYGVSAIVYIEGRVLFQRVPDLPGSLANSCGAVIGDVLYVAGGTTGPSATIASGSFYSLDLSQSDARWEQLTTWPGPPRTLSVAGSHAGRFYLLSGASLKPGGDGLPQRTYLKDAYSYHPDNAWRRLSDMPRAAVAAASPAYSNATAGLVVFGGDDGSHAHEVASLREEHPGFSSDVLCYGPHGDSWTMHGQMKTIRRPDAAANPNASMWAQVMLPFVLWGDTLVFPSGEARPAIRMPRTVIAKASLQ